MEDINELPKPVQEKIEELKTKNPLAGEDLAFLMARRDYLTEEEKEKLFPKKEEPIEEIIVKKRGRKPTKTA